MYNEIGETVIFTKDLHCRFSSENIEQLKVYNFSKKAFDNCEDWSSDDENKCYKVADFNVDVSNEKTRFYYGESIIYGFFNHKPENLYFLPVGTYPPKGFNTIGSESFEEYYKVPCSMWDFGMFIDDFLFKVISQKNALSMEFAYEFSKQCQLVNVETDDNDLPF